MITPPKTLMIFAAGLGKRLLPITNQTPKPLVQILDKPLLYWCLDLAKSYDFDNIIINTHHLHLQIEEAIFDYQALHSNLPQIDLIYEPELLDTGGAVKNAASLFASQFIVTLNSDIIFPDSANLLQDLIQTWQKNIVDVLLLLQKSSNTIGYREGVNFILNDEGMIFNKNSENSGQKIIFTGLQIINSEIIINYPEKVFSLNKFFDPKKYQIRGMLNSGRWLHVSDPQSVLEVEETLK